MSLNVLLAAKTEIYLKFKQLIALNSKEILDWKRSQIERFGES